MALAGAAMVAGRSRLPLGPQDRAVVLITTGCGHGAAGHGSGVAMGGDLVLTAAHVVAQADLVTVRRNGREYQGSVVVWDRPHDLALVTVDGWELPAAEFGVLALGDEATMVGGLTSGTRQARVAEWVRLTIEEALGTDRYPRLGYQLQVEAADGDSGAGVYDADGRLAGMVFGVDPAGAFAWATAAEEIQSVMAASRSLFECDPATSFLRESAGL